MFANDSSCRGSVNTYLFSVYITFIEVMKTEIKTEINMKIKIILRIDADLQSVVISQTINKAP